ncbi:MAG: hypothetical protein UZ18_ATM001002183 [Armatimonadetes bacterium OLB18]|nr:MAG: hypothetical protein UZ18_ATM001002183 [Armatimonadetes bacterium OLB18]
MAARRTTPSWWPFGGDLSEEAAEAQIPREERRSMPPALGRAAATTQ